MTNMSIQPLRLTYFIEILLVLEFQLTKTYFGTFSYKAHFRPQISFNGKVTCFVKECAVVMDQFETVIKINVLPLGSYDILIGMDWLEQHRVILNCYDKTFTCINNHGKSISVKGIPRKTTIRYISAL